jgi:hypothetical protein
VVLVFGVNGADGVPQLSGEVGWWHVDWLTVRNVFLGEWWCHVAWGEGDNLVWVIWLNFGGAEDVPSGGVWGLTLASWALSSGLLCVSWIDAFCVLMLETVCDCVWVCMHVWAFPVSIWQGRGNALFFNIFFTQTKDGMHLQVVLCWGETTYLRASPPAPESTSVFSTNFHLSSVWHQWNKKCSTFVQILDGIIILWWKFAQMDEKWSNWMKFLAIKKWVFEKKFAIWRYFAPQKNTGKHPRPKGDVPIFVMVHRVQVGAPITKFYKTFNKNHIVGF